MKTKRTIIICFDDRKWIQETVFTDSLTTDDVVFETYFAEYEKVKAAIPVMKLVSPSIIHGTFVD